MANKTYKTKEEMIDHAEQLLADIIVIQFDFFQSKKRSFDRSTDEGQYDDFTSTDVDNFI